MFLRVFEVSWFPGGFEKLREVCTKNFYLFLSDSELIVPSYEHFDQKVNDKKLTNMFNVNVEGRKNKHIQMYFLGF